ncbi:hypothetical protein FJZ31_21720 [Candidatus Poribacteria bacterium]|nr:hypothetical protein [Candidatus Poribacteria bacterium]
MGAILSIDFDQIKSLVVQFDVNDKIKLIQLLEEETFPVRFKQFLNKVKTDDLSMDEITVEVETVRRKRYNEKR